MAFPVVQMANPSLNEGGQSEEATLIFCILSKKAFKMQLAMLVKLEPLNLLGNDKNINVLTF